MDRRERERELEKTIGVRVPISVKRALEAEAERVGTTVSALLRRLITDRFRPTTGEDQC